MDLFDPKFVKFMWNDELKEKSVFVADNIKQLQEKVDLYEDARIYVDKNSVAGMPFKEHSTFDPSRRWLFAYYDPNYDCKVAFKKGKKIESRVAGADCDWHTSEKPAWDSGFEYRIKPENEQTKFLTWEMLSKWLADGFGVVHVGCAIQTFLTVREDEWNKEVPPNLQVRFWEDDDWHQATREYCYDDEQYNKISTEEQ